MEKSNYKRSETEIHVKPLSEFNNSAGADDLLDSFVGELSNSYAIPYDKLMRLVMYIISFDIEIPRLEAEMVDSNKIKEFENAPKNINRIRFECDNCSFEIINPFVIDKLYHILYSEYQEKSKKRVDKLFYSNKKVYNHKTVKLKATQIFKELIQYQNISDWKAYCIIGFIFAQFGIGIKNGKGLMRKDEYNIYRETQFKSESYLAYLAGNIKRYITK